MSDEKNYNNLKVEDTLNDDLTKDNKLILNKENTEADIKNDDNNKLSADENNSQLSEHSAMEVPEELGDIIIFYLKIFSGTALFFLSRFFQQLINISILGIKYNNPHMIDALGLAHLYTNVLLFSFCCVCIYTLDFLGSRAYGQKHYRLYGLMLHRTFIMIYFKAMYKSRTYATFLLSQ